MGHSIFKQPQIVALTAAPESELVCVFQYHCPPPEVGKKKNPLRTPRCPSPGRQGCRPQHRVGYRAAALAGSSGPAASLQLDGRSRVVTGALVSCPLFRVPSPVPSRLFRDMEDEDGYMALDKRGAARSPGPLQGAGSRLRDPQGGVAPRQARVLAGAPRCPRCLLGALTAALALSLVVCVSLLVVERGQPRGTPGCGNASLGCSCAGLGCIDQELRKRLCPLREREGCQLCPVNWTLRGTKCHWVSDEIGSWGTSREDCVNRSAALLMPGDQDELGFLNKVLQRPARYFWIGLSLRSDGKSWTWLNGSRLDQSRFPLSPRDGNTSCGMLREGRISSGSCSSALQWICQKEATQL